MGSRASVRLLGLVEVRAVAPAGASVDARAAAAADEGVDETAHVVVQAGRSSALLCLLSLANGSAVSNDLLMNELWGDELPESGVAALHVVVSRLRRQLVPTEVSIVARAPGYVLEGASNDVALFELAAARALAAAENGEWKRAAAAASEALQLWAGVPFAGAAESDLLNRTRDRLERLRRRLRRTTAEAAVHEGHAHEAVELVQTLVAEDPLDEESVALLMRAEARASRRIEALAAYDRYRVLLRDELGLDPGPAVRRVHAEILSSDLTDAPAATAGSPNAASVAAATTPTPIPPPSTTQPATAPPPITRKPAARATHSDLALIARDTEQALLLGALDTLGRVVVLEGEPGIGKTALAQFAAGHARARGMRVVWCRANDGAGTPPLWLWEQALADLSRAYDREPRPGSAIIAELTGQTDDLTSRFRLAESIAQRVIRSIQHEPALLVLDDLQWADEGSLQITQLLAQSIRSRPIALVVTARTGASRTAALDSTLAAIAREDAVERRRLAPFSLSDVESYLASRREPSQRTAVPHQAGRPEGGSLTDAHGVARQLLARSGGNPFYLAELVIAGEPGVPATVFELVRQRLVHFDRSTIEALQLAAVAARTIDVPVVAHCLGWSPLDARVALQPAIDDGLVSVDGGALSFTHDLVRDAIADSVGVTQQASMHGTIAAAIAEVYAEEPDAHLDELADHLFRAAGGGVSPQAFSACMAAADAALSRLAYDQAAVHRARALSALETGEDSRERRWNVLMKLTVERRFSGDVEGASLSLRQAIFTARRIGDTDLMRQTLLVLGSVTLWNWRHFGEVDEEVIAELRALIAQRQTDADRAALLGTLAVELYFWRDHEQGIRTAREAVELARTTGDDVLLSRTLNNLTVASFFPGFEAERRAAAAEALSLPGVPPVTETIALILHGCLSLQRADIETARGDFDRAGWLAPRLGLPEIEGQLATALSGFAIMRGEFDLAEELFERQRAMYHRTTLWSSDFSVTVQRLQIARLTKTVDSVVADIVDMAADETNRVFRWPAIVALAEAGDEKAARQYLSRWALRVDQPFVHWASDWEWSQAAEASLLLGLPYLDDLYERLAVQRGGIALVGTASAVLGPTSGLLARLARASGDEARAERDAREAAGLREVVARSLGHEPFFTLG